MNPEWISAIGSVGTAIAAWCAVNAWKRELKGRHEYELALKLYSALLEQSLIVDYLTRTANGTARFTWTDEELDRRLTESTTTMQSLLGPADLHWQYGFGQDFIELSRIANTIILSLNKTANVPKDEQNRALEQFNDRFMKVRKFLLRIIR